MRTKLRKFPFTKLGKPLEQFLACNQSQYRISQKLELLVVADLVLALARLLRFHLARLRAVGHGLLNHGTPPEVIAQALFQRRDFPFLHR